MIHQLNIHCLVPVKGGGGVLRMWSAECRQPTVLFPALPDRSLGMVELLHFNTGSTILENPPTPKCIKWDKVGGEKPAVSTTLCDQNCHIGKLYTFIHSYRNSRGLRR